MADHQVVDYLRVLHDFDARSPDELTLKKNSKIELLERDEEYNDGWYLGRDPESGKVGLFPQVYTAQWPPESAFSQPTILENQVAPDSDIAPPPAYSSAPSEPKQEIPKRLSVTPSELTLDEAGKYGGSAKDVTAETPPLALENNVDKRRVSEDFKREHPQIQKLSRSPVVEDTLSDIEEALSEIRTAPRSVGTHAQKNKQPPPIMETPEAHAPAEQDFDDSASDYSRSAFDNESSLSLAIANQPSVSGYLEPSSRATYTGRSRESIQRQSDHPLQYSQQFEPESSSDEDGDIIDPVYSAEEIRCWTPAQVSAYFQEQHLPLSICDKFEEQEINGAIVLQLEMAHLKELELGSFGKRFEVWKEIEKLQSIVKSAGGSISEAAKEKKARHRSSSTPAGVLPRLPSLHNRPPARGGSLAVPSTHIEEAIYDPMNPIRESPTTMSPSSPGPVPPPKSDVGSAVHSDGRSISTASMERASSSGGQQPQRVPGVHGRDPSFDRAWTLKGHKANESSASGRSRYTGDSGFASQSSSSVFANESRSYHNAGASEDGGKRDRNVLHKRAGSSGSHGHHVVHSKKSSYTEEQRSRSGNNTPTSTPSSPLPYPPNPPPPHPPSPSPSLRGVVSKQTFPVSERSYETVHLANAYPYAQAPRPFSRESINQSFVPSGYSSPSPASIAYHNTVKGRKRSTSETQIASLDSRARESLAASAMPGGKPLSVERPPPVEEKHVPPSIQTKAGHPHRSISDGAEKAMSMSPMSQDTNSTLMSPNGSEHSASIKITIDAPERKSDESKQRNGSSGKDKKLRSVASASGIRQKSKKQLTSAYLEGLKEVKPADAAKDADFSGWMKKRGSSAVVASWKTRFFVLKGRRLSYFYSMDDIKERGLIDITSHRVLPASDDRLVSLHASVAAITSSPSHASSATPGNGQSGPNLPPTPPSKGGWFTFKLVPPQPGAAKGVMFTPPKLHYFATDSKQIGREWMAAFMKATIDRDETAPVISTFSANTISLAKARAMRARPPGFGDNSTDPAPSPALGLPIMSSQGSFNDSIESALAERHLIDDDAANAADDER
ncbi:hypothetical protein TWF102_006328 [Orbilia oligospora]|uniref:Polar growth protein n=1 Tax=Orbilia oligospora TaxID=2813651 RepID=A0A7C8NXM2_ORBOL|nr:hypothetical protein TWF103_000876 [Orbilia oligospora]KAF3097345.1 hypothetical protein TWF102_006328 [Orbilia oligospora]KAF3145277.1 hypothetical protein TWF703_007861 [Orbilia oligospora]